MSKTDHKKRKLPGFIGEPFVGLRRRMVQSPAWRSLSAITIKVYLELKLTYRHKRGEQNNGLLGLSCLQLHALIGISTSSACRAYAELEAKGFLVMTRPGEAGALPSSGTLNNGGTGYQRMPAQWAITEEPWSGKPATHAYERWRPGLRWDRDKGDFVPESRPKRDSKKAEKQFYGSTGGTAMVPPMERQADYGSASGTVRGASKSDHGSASGVSIVNHLAASPAAPDSDRRRHPAPQAPEKQPQGDFGPSAGPNGKVRKGGGGWYGARGTPKCWPGPERLAIGITQEQLATVTGLSRPYIATLEQGKCKPSRERRALIEAGLSELAATMATAPDLAEMRPVGTA